MNNTSNISQFSVGQLWSYKTRTGEEKSTVLINRIDSHSKHGKIFHISIFRVNAYGLEHSESVSAEHPHIPISEDAFKNSVVQLIKQTNTNPEYLEGYNIWKEAFDNGKAGIFSITLAEIVEL